MRELLGLIGSLCVCVSMIFKTDTFRGALLLRSLNLIGSLIFIIYGLSLNAISIYLLNIIASSINIYHIIKLVKDQA